MARMKERLGDTPAGIRMQEEWERKASRILAKYEEMAEIGVDVPVEEVYKDVVDLNAVLRALAASGCG